MTWVDNSLLWIGGVLLVFLGAWFRNFLTVLVPSPQRTILALKNLVFLRSPARDRVRVVLGWLDNDYKGNNTTAVSATFTEIEGIELCRSACIVSASGAADEWRTAMRRKARDLLKTWNADIAVVGRVDKDGDALSLWFISSREKDRLADTAGNPYALRFNRLSDDFVEDLRIQIRALVLPLVIPKATNDGRRQRGLRQLKTAVPKLENLFRTLPARQDRMSLCMVYLLAQSCLGEWLGEAERLRSAIERAKEITVGGDIGEDADASLATRFNLARTLIVLGEREGNPDYLAESISLLEEALNGVDDADRVSIAAAIKGLTANALRALGNLVGSPDHLRRAASLLESALEVHQRQSQAPLVAISQNNLGLVYLELARVLKQRGPLERAISLFESASRVVGQEKMPTLWSMTQNNTGQAHEALAEQGSGAYRTELEKSRDHYQKAVHGYSRTETPFHLASAKTNLARVLTRFGALDGSIDQLTQAIECLEDAHALSSKDAKATSVGAISAGLGVALRMRGKIRANTRDVENAVPWLERALETYDPDVNPENWVKVKTNLALSYFQLSEARNDIEAAVQGFSLLEEVLIEHDLGTAVARCPETYIAFGQGIDLVKSMGHRADYVRDWIGKWVPVFTKREHRGVPRHVLGIIQNDMATFCQDSLCLTDAVNLYRRALANVSTDGDVNETASSACSTFHSQPVASEPVDPDRLVVDVKGNLGTACRMLGEERSCARLLREALALFDEVLAGLDPAVDPMDWARTQSSKGRAYKALYHVEGDVELLRLSLSAYDEALQHLVDGIDTPWHRQVPGRREEVRMLLEQIGSAP